MTNWDLLLQTRFYDAILAQHKQVEGRVPDPSKPEKAYNNMRRGDTMTFIAVDSHFKPMETIPRIQYEIATTRLYPTVEQMLQTEGLQRVLPGEPTLESGIAVYHSFPGYEERVRQFGIMAATIGERLR